MNISKKGVDFICKYEGFKSKSYKDFAMGVWTIGYGSTMWDNGNKVKEGETITKERAIQLLQWECSNKVSALSGLKLNQNQVDALLSFIYNLGVGAFGGSTLKKKIKMNPNDLSIKDEFAKWNKARIDGVLTPVDGLTARRKAESEMYFSSL